MSDKPNLFIALPAFRDTFSGGTTVSLMALASALTRARIDYSLSKGDRGDPSDVRNLLASVFLATKKFTHLLIIDADVTFAPSAIEKCLRSKADVIGCAAPLRGGNGVIFNAGQVLSRTKTYAKVEEIGTGVLLISRGALEKLAAHPRLSRRRTHAFQALHPGPIHGFFDPIIDPKLGRLGDDMSFCARWRELCKGDIFAVIDEQIGRVETRTVTGKLSDQLDKAADKQGEKAVEAQTPGADASTVMAIPPVPSSAPLRRSALPRPAAK